MKTVNLELSQKLKSNGYPQRGVEFYWMLPHEDALDEDALDEDALDEDALGKDYVFGQLKEYGTINLIDFCASPTADEILEVLPFGTTVHKCEDGTFTAHAVNQERLSKGDTASNALAKLWLYFNKEDLL